MNGHGHFLKYLLARNKYLGTLLLTRPVMYYFLCFPKVH